jgi:hypothetical protein
MACLFQWATGSIRAYVHKAGEKLAGSRLMVSFAGVPPRRHADGFDSVSG